MTWTDERVDRLKTFWREGLSASQIAKKLGGVSRNAVIGKANRLKLGGRERPSAPPAPKRTNVQPRKRTPHNNFAAINIECAAAFAPIPGSEPVPWTLRGFGCAWPVDVPDAAGQHSCALPCDEGATYCAAHLRLRAQPAALGKPKRSADELIRALRRWAA